MPIYEYECETCGCRFEELVRSNDEHIACPSCYSGRTRKLPSVFGMRSASPDGGAGRSSCSTCSAKSCSTCR